MKSLVSVIIPVFNCIEFLDECLASVFGQGYDALEIIAVDDGSTDGSIERLESYGDRIRLVRQSHKGPAAARNAGVAASSGEYIAFIDADDVWLPGKLQAQLDYMAEHPAIKIVYGRHIHWPANSDGSYPAALPFAASAGPKTTPSPSGWIYPQMLVDSYVHIITALIRREVFDHLNGFDGSFGKGSDYDFWLRASYDFEIHFVEQAAALYRDNPGGISYEPARISAQYAIVTRAIKQHGLAGRNGAQVDKIALNRYLANICRVHADMNYGHGNKRVAHDYYGKAWRLGLHTPKLFCYWFLTAFANDKD